MSSQNWPITATGPFSEGERATLIELAERGWKAGPIARRLGRALGSVYYYIVREGFAAPPKNRPVSYMRRGKMVRAFSKEEDTFIKQMSMDGCTPTQASRAYPERFGFERKPHSIKARLNQLAVIEEN